jgi:hypothetical protein
MLDYDNDQLLTNWWIDATTNTLYVYFFISKINNTKSIATTLLCGVFIMCTHGDLYGVVEKMKQ